MVKSMTYVGRKDKSTQQQRC